MSRERRCGQYVDCPRPPKPLVLATHRLLIPSLDQQVIPEETLLDQLADQAGDPVLVGLATGQVSSQRAHSRRHSDHSIVTAHFCFLSKMRHGCCCLSSRRLFSSGQLAGFFLGFGCAGDKHRQSTSLHHCVVIAFDPSLECSLISYIYGTEMEGCLYILLLSAHYDISRDALGEVGDRSKSTLFPIYIIRRCVPGMRG